MFLKNFFIVFTLLNFVLISSSAIAQSSPNTTTSISQPKSATILQPHSQYYIPVESGALDSHLDLQFEYAPTDLSFLGSSAWIHILMLGLEGQVAIADRLELGLNIPFLNHFSITGSEGIDQGKTEFGNLALNLKGKLAGDSRGTFAMSAFANTTLPTGSGIRSREYVQLQSGLAVSGAINNITLGADMGTIWSHADTQTVLGANVQSADFVLYNFDLHGAVKLHRLVSAYMAMQIAMPVYPDADTPAVALAPGLQFFPAADWHFDLGARIAVNDAGKIYTPLSRAAFMFAVGYSFGS